jgi:hypothetical protein
MNESMYAGEKLDSLDTEQLKLAVDADPRHQPDWVASKYVGATNPSRRGIIGHTYYAKHSDGSIDKVEVYYDGGIQAEYEPLDREASGDMNESLNENSSRYIAKKLRKGKYGGVDVVGFFEYPRHSVLAGQMGTAFIDNYDTEEEALSAHPDADGYTGKYTQPTPSVSHLPGDDDPDDLYYDRDDDVYEGKKAKCCCKEKGKRKCPVHGKVEEALLPQQKAVQKQADKAARKASGRIGAGPGPEMTTKGRVPYQSKEYTKYIRDRASSVDEETTESKKWVQKAVKGIKKGALRKQEGKKKDEKFSKSELKSLAKSGTPLEKKRAQFALNISKKKK